MSEQPREPSIDPQPGELGDGQVHVRGATELAGGRATGSRAGWGTVGSESGGGVAGRGAGGDDGNGGKTGAFGRACGAEAAEGGGAGWRGEPRLTFLGLMVRVGAAAAIAVSAYCAGRVRAASKRSRRTAIVRTP